jgi:tetratricopeptide (TPR) repeat protein
VGAKTVVVGSYQKAGTELRINARFVEVETGVVLDTAKATGPVTKVFSLQDQVVDKLLGAAPATRPPRKATEKTVKAYELWTKSLSGSDSEKLSLLKASLELDPEFPYALQDLDALKKRIADYRKVREGALPTQTNLIWDRIADARLSGYERALAVENLLKIRRDERRYRSLLADAQKVLAISMPDPPPGTIPAGPEAALFAQLEAQFELRLRDEAVRSAETYLKRYPAGIFYKEVEGVLDELVTERKRQNGQKDFFAERAERLEEAKKEAAQKYTGEDLEKRLYSLESERCDLIDRFSLVIWDVMAKVCGYLVKKYENDPRDWVRDDIRQARFRLAIALGELGRFDEAVPLMRKIEADNPSPAAMGYHARDQLNEWPADAMVEK